MMGGGERKREFSAPTQMTSTFETEDGFINFFAMNIFGFLC